MKKLAVILLAVASLVCACNKYDDAISDLEKRVYKSEKNIEDLLDRVDALEKIISNLQEGVVITSVTAVEGGFKVAFSDGSSFTVVNGEDSTVSFTEDNLCYYFDFGDGNKVAVSKAGAFGLKVDNDVVGLAPGEPATVPFTVIGGDNTTKVIVEDCDYDVKVGDGELTITAAKVKNGKFVLKAIRNSDGANSAVVITIVKQAVGNVTFEIEVTDITKTGAIAHITPSNKNVHYLAAIEKKSYTDQFATDAELIAADMDYWFERYGESYAEYDFNSYEELFLEGLCVMGDSDADYTEYLKAGTEYVAYAFAVDDDLNPVTTDVCRTEFKTPDEEALDATYLGVGIWHDVFVSGVFTMSNPDCNFDLPVDVYEDNATPGIFYFDSPYNYANQAQWYNTTPEDMEQYDGNWRKAVIMMDATDPDHVIFDMQDLGVCCNTTYGWMSAGSVFEGVELSAGVYDGSVISFSGAMYTSLSKYNPTSPWDDMNEDGTFSIIMPEKDGIKAADCKCLNPATDTRIAKAGFAKKGLELISK